MPRPPRRTLAVILQVKDHGESDKIVTCYCPRIGKLTGIAKGAKRSKKRFVNKLELFSLLEIHFTAGDRSSLVRIDQADLGDPFPALRSDYQRYGGATLLCELLLHWTRENDGDEELFRLLVWALAGLNRGEPITRTIVLFQIKLFDLLGYRPHLAGCIDCGRQDGHGTPYRFSSSRGGLLCSHCTGEASLAHIPLSLNTAKLLHLAQSMSRDKLARLRFSDTSGREAMALFKRYHNDLLQREIHSWQAIF